MITFTNFICWNTRHYRIRLNIFCYNCTSSNNSTFPYCNAMQDCDVWPDENSVINYDWSPLSWHTAKEWIVNIMRACPQRNIAVYTYIFTNTYTTSTSVYNSFISHNTTFSVREHVTLHHNILYFVFLYLLDISFYIQNFLYDEMVYKQSKKHVIF